MDTALLLAAFTGPFVQEDVAVWAAAAAIALPSAVTGPAAVKAGAAMLAGLIVSDLWKYAIGHLARRVPWAARMAGRPQVQAFGARIRARPGITLMLARFVPGTRIPAYIAAGVFSVPFGVFAAWVCLSAVAYAGLAVGLLAALGQVAGPAVMPGVAGIVLCGVLAQQVIRARPGHRSPTTPGR